MKRPRHVITLAQLAARLRAAGFTALVHVAGVVSVNRGALFCGYLHPVQNEDYATATRDITRNCLPIVKAIQKAP